MSAKIQPSDEFVFKKPLPCKPPLTAFDPTYVQRKQEVEEKTFTCKSGRKFCYFTDGAQDPSQDDVAVVLCLHGSSSSKYFWMLPQPLQGVFQICPDRFGHGNSSSTSGDGYSFADGCPEFLELMDHVYAEKKIPAAKKFFVTGHSMGGTWTYMMAACPEASDKIEAIAPICGPSDGTKMTKEEFKKAGTAGFMTGLKKKGCSGSFNRWLFKTLMMPHLLKKDTPGDNGMAEKYKQYRDGCGSDARANAALDADPFYATSTVDVNRGHNTKADAMDEWTRCWAEPWSYDAANIKVPCFIYNGEKEVVARAFADYHHRVIQGSELTIWSGHSEVTIVIELKRIIEALVKKQKVQGGPSFST